MGVKPDATRMSLVTDAAVITLTVLSHIQWTDTERNTKAICLVFQFQCKHKVATAVYRVCKIWVSHDGDWENDCLLRRSLVDGHQTTRRHIPQDSVS